MAADAICYDPLALLGGQARGSHGASGWVAGVGFAKLPEVIEAFADDPVDDVPGWVAVAPVAALVDVAEDPAVVLVEDTLGGFTAKLVPVTTVTCAPLVTLNGSRAIITEPDIESATCWAAASSAGVMDE